MSDEIVAICRIVFFISKIFCHHLSAVQPDFNFFVRSAASRLEFRRIKPFDIRFACTMPAKEYAFIFILCGRA
jgi:hypothetical protein